MRTSEGECVQVKVSQGLVNAVNSLAKYIATSWNIHYGGTLLMGDVVDVVTVHPCFTSLDLVQNLT